MRFKIGPFRIEITTSDVVQEVAPAPPVTTPTPVDDVAPLGAVQPRPRPPHEESYLNAWLDNSR